MVSSAATSQPLGDPLPLDGAALDQAALITPVDVAQAAAFWRNTLRLSILAYLWSLLDARPVAVAGAFQWVTGQRHYLTPRGAILAENRVRAAVTVALSAQAATLARITTQMQAREITLAEWEAGMLQAIKTAHLVSASAACGGWAQLDAQGNAWLSGRMRVQLVYLLNFALQLANGTQPMGASLLRRVAMYAHAGGQTFEAMERREAQRAGAAYERRILGVADHCDVCLEEAAKGWQPVGVLREIGDSPCLSNCRCHWEFQMAVPFGALAA